MPRCERAEFSRGINLTRLLPILLFAGSALFPTISSRALETEPPLPPRRPTPLAAPDVRPTARVSGPESEAAEDCLASLIAAGAAVKPVTIGAQADPLCAVAQPVSLESLALRSGQRVDLPDRPTLDCVTAATFASFVDEALAPLVKGSFGASITAIATGPGFECRTRDYVAGAKLSEHAAGLAIDIASITFGGGRVYQVGQMTDAAERAFDHAARAAACGYFHTALGPGADSFHNNHWHVDLEARGRDRKSKFCQ